jgi:hypothetical protein
MSQDETESSGGDLSLGDLRNTGKPSLARLDVVDKLVRDFVASVLLVKSGFQQGDESAREPLKVIEEQARQMGDIIMGRNPHYDAQPWQSNSRLGNTIRVLIPNHAKKYGDPGCALFMWLANQALKASATLDEGTTEEAVRAKLAEVVEDVVARIMGVR